VAFQILWVSSLLGPQVECDTQPRLLSAYVNAEDAMGMSSAFVFSLVNCSADPDDLIFVRAPPRLGQRFQVTGLEAHMTGPPEYSGKLSGESSATLWR
jgi:hypothetical protein